MKDKFEFNKDEIDSRVDIQIETKYGERLSIIRTKVKSNVLLGNNHVHHLSYYILNSDGIVVGKVPVTVSDNSSSTASMDYWIKDVFQDRGIGSVMLKAIINDILLETKPLDNLIFSSLREPSISTTKITTISLDINEDNFASQRIAEKNGFVKQKDNQYTMSIQDLIKDKYGEDDLTP